jgi:RNA polymerase sigma-70 factor (ECF subfamily)
VRWFSAVIQYNGRLPSLEASEEVQLARDLLAGRVGAFDHFVARFRSKLLNYSFLVCRQREDAEEITQETLLRVFQNLNQLKDPERVKAWVFRIARNACLMKRRKSVFAPERELSLDEFMPNSSQVDGQKRIEIADWSALPEDQAFQAELRRALDDAIAGLPEIYKTVLLLRDVEELTTEETAEVLDITTDTVKTRLHRARLAVRKGLDDFIQVAQSPNRSLSHH